jgi:hypothetical protein
MRCLAYRWLSAARYNNGTAQSRTNFSAFSLRRISHHEQCRRVILLSRPFESAKRSLGILFEDSVQAHIMQQLARNNARRAQRGTFSHSIAFSD